MAEATVGMFEFLKTEDNFLAFCPWILANEKMGHLDISWTKDCWYQYDRLPLKVVDAMKNSAPALVQDKTLGNALASALALRTIVRDQNLALYRFIVFHGLSATSLETEVQYNGETYTAQGCIDPKLWIETPAVVYCKKGDWGNIQYLPLTV
jgi:hypothetical protein